ncbi:hypothetical protein AVEN_150916-1 [Araneus ventricosus]|uniref:Uncharacterized protein n=1 Tax=Araneus ventricosus TaxID=182803 RepID=A0A4Y2C8I8_ARAVE|nr:hypothetical protein AVEN_150916-1 [Araneus ventricosus]
MTRTTLELASSFPNFCAKPAEGRLAHVVRFNVHQTHTHGVSLVESVFEAGNLRPQGLNVTSRPPLTQDMLEVITCCPFYVLIKNRYYTALKSLSKIIKTP